MNSSLMWCHAISSTHLPRQDGLQASHHCSSLIVGWFWTGWRCDVTDGIRVDGDRPALTVPHYAQICICISKVFSFTNFMQVLNESAKASSVPLCNTYKVVTDLSCSRRYQLMLEVQCESLNWKYERLAVNEFIWNEIYPLEEYEGKCTWVLQK